MKTNERIGFTLLAGAFFALYGCSDNTLGFDVKLQQEIYGWDFGGASGTLPQIACGATDGSACNQLPGLTVDASAVTGAPSSATISAGCDTSSGLCFAQANARVAESVDVQLDPGWKGRVEGKLVSFVRDIDLTYRVPSNTLTFDVPKVDVFVGPAGATKETDAGVVPVGSTTPIAAGATLDGGHLPIEDSSPAHDIIESAVRNKQPFVFVLVFAPRIDSGHPVPAGAVEVDVTPKLTLGL